VTGANTNDSIVFEALLDDVPPLRTPAGQWRRRPERSTPTRPTIIVAAAPPSPAGASRSASPAVGSSRGSGWAVTAGSGAHDRLAARVPSAAHPLRRQSERFVAYAMLACDRLCYNRLPCATMTWLP
jgi:hypothetical protein